VDFRRFFILGEYMTHLNTKSANHNASNNHNSGSLNRNSHLVHKTRKKPTVSPITLCNPTPYLSTKTQKKCSSIPKSIRATEGLKVYQGPFNRDEAAYKNAHKPMPLRKSSKYIILHDTGNMGRKGNMRIIANDRLAHFFIDRQGRAYQMIPNLASQTNHVGHRTLWGLHKGTDLKAHSIGIEFLGDPEKGKPTAAQYQTGKKLVRSLMKMYGIPSNRVLSHGMVSCDNISAKKPTRGRYRDIDGAHFVSREGRHRLCIGPGPQKDPNGARPGPATKKIVYDSLRPEKRQPTTFVALKERETLWSFSKRSGIPLATIYKLNQGIKPTEIPDKCKIRVPRTIGNIA